MVCLLTEKYFKVSKITFLGAEMLSNFVGLDWGKMTANSNCTSAYILLHSTLQHTQSGL